MSNQILSLFDGESNSILLNLLVISLDGVQRYEYFLRNDSFCEFEHSFESVETKDWHDARNYQAIDAHWATVSDPLIEYVVVIEQLSYNKVCASFNFFFKVLYVIIAAWSLQMSFWVTCYANTKEISILLLDKVDEIDSIVEPIFVVNPVCSTSWRVTTQSQYVPNS